MPKGSPVFTIARLLPRALPFLVVVAMMPGPVPAAAWAPPPTLKDESFSGNVTTTPQCALDLTGTFGFTVTSGTATGSYSGSFSESGSVGISMISVTSFTADFTITATNGDTVVGMKASTPPPNTFGTCSDAFALNVPSFYSAVITVAASGERWCDQGTAVTTITGVAFTFTESFTSELTQPTLMTSTSTCPVPTS
jgi:hypothetical protein